MFGMAERVCFQCRRTRLELETGGSGVVCRKKRLEGTKRERKEGCRASTGGFEAHA